MEGDDHGLRGDEGTTNGELSTFSRAQFMQLVQDAASDARGEAQISFADLQVMRQLEENAEVGSEVRAENAQLSAFSHELREAWRAHGEELRAQAGNQRQSASASVASAKHHALKRGDGVRTQRQEMRAKRLAVDEAWRNRGKAQAELQRDRKAQMRSERELAISSRQEAAHGVKVAESRDTERAAQEREGARARLMQRHATRASSHREVVRGSKQSVATERWVQADTARMERAARERQRFDNRVEHLAGALACKAKAQSEGELARLRYRIKCEDDADEMRQQERRQQEQRFQQRLNELASKRAVRDAIDARTTLASGAQALAHELLERVPPTTGARRGQQGNNGFAMSAQASLAHSGGARSVVRDEAGTSTADDEHQETVRGMRVNALSESLYHASGGSLNSRTPRTARAAMAVAPRPLRENLSPEQRAATVNRFFGFRKRGSGRVHTSEVAL